MAKFNLVATAMAASSLLSSSIIISAAQTEPDDGARARALDEFEEYDPPTFVAVSSLVSRYW